LNKRKEVARSKICLSIDGLKTMEEVETLIKELHALVGLFKVGKEALTRFGLPVIQLIQEHGAKVFLDLKYHDIPNTVQEAAAAATEHGVYLFNVHASGGLAMMRAALKGAKEASRTTGKSLPKIVAVTVLTSINQKTLTHELLVKKNLNNYVLHLAKLAAQANLNGIVCSAQDLPLIKNKLPLDFIYITPGIAGVGTPAGFDQKRISLPHEAIKNGATILVVGRAITSAKNRVQASVDILQDILNNSD